MNQNRLKYTENQLCYTDKNNRLRRIFHDFLQSYVIFAKCHEKIYAIIV